MGVLIRELGLKSYRMHGKSARKNFTRRSASDRFYLLAKCEYQVRLRREYSRAGASDWYFPSDHWQEAEFTDMTGAR
jgi:hypothetical protein